MTNTLYYGDNLDVLRNRLKDETIDLIYLDPPFKSDANYNVFFPSADDDGAQVEAFKDTWKWGEAAERAYDDVRNSGRLGLALSGMRRWLEPIQEERIHAERVGRVRRRSMMRIMARRKKAATVRA
ncbi:MAG TPA: hypothetical protein VFC56_07630 [Stellaceae bacterium]|nr:hypothetical protein [Stellaceae bacterium]